MLPPRTTVISSFDIGPGRRIAGTLFVRSRTVDSSPILHFPPSRMGGQFSPKESETSCGVVELTLEKRFALGAARGWPVSWRIFLNKGWEGERIATVLSPAVTLSGIICLLGRMSVRGPGQKLWQRRLAFGLR